MDLRLTYLPDESRLAMAMSDGSIACVTVRRGLGPDGTWVLSIDTMQEIDKGDGRIITALKWLDVSWTCPDH